jgi:adenylate cyclase
MRPVDAFPCYDGLCNLDLGNMAEADCCFAPAWEVCAQRGLDPEALGVQPNFD